ncbi:3'(2'),5'-bisphosphate nucleotidase CysQ [Desulforhabdus amnigena]|uniref:3'(2'),5'-bisphosphate nucleotidase CysQ n=1 Tax=Desulforhabdus amnigena TaxID=40218 RepID=A0A9W6D0P7_9BACT|nr:3'(2'),5'-bisphosphate nucleotidase CysQ [Desulforhabdus amnigena]
MSSKYKMTREISKNTEGASVIDLDFLENLARKAGESIMQVYETDFSVQQKEDKSPLTLADLRSHEVIVSGLQSHYPDIPVLSEEGRAIPYSTRRKWARFWCVDPLDGTKEFVKRDGEFTVNIALIEGTTPVLGIIYIPVAQCLYMGKMGSGCWETTKGERRKLHVQRPRTNAPVRVLMSRHHPSPHLDEILDALPAYEPIKRGSALKFCALAKGEADFYPRTGPTSEWDTAAGHAIVAAAGGVMVNLQGKPFTYNKESLTNGPFLAAPSLEWLQETGVLQRASSMKLDESS